MLETAKGLRAPLDRMFIKHDLARRVPATCEGACVFNTNIVVYLGLGIVAAAVLLAVHQEGYFVSDLSSGGGIAGTVVLSAVLGLSLLRVMIVFVPVMSAGLPCTLPAAPALRPVFAAAAPPAVPVRAVYVICNTTSGTRLGYRILHDIVLPAFTAAGVAVTVLETQYGGHARDYALTVPFAGYDALVVIGGDGSLMETVNGMLSRPDGARLPVGLVPGGSGNSVATDLGTLRCSEAVANVIAGVAFDSDVNLVVDGAFMAAHAAERRRRARALTEKAKTATTTATETEATESASASEGATASASSSSWHRNMMFELMLSLNPIARADVAAADAAAAADLATRTTATATPTAAVSRGGGDAVVSTGESSVAQPLFGLPAPPAGGYDTYPTCTDSTDTTTHGSRDGRITGAGVDAESASESASAVPLAVFSSNEIALGLIGDIGATAESCRNLGPARYDLCGLWAAMKLQKLHTEVVYPRPAFPSTAAAIAAAAAAAGSASAGGIAKPTVVRNGNGHSDNGNDVALASSSSVALALKKKKESSASDPAASHASASARESASESESEFVTVSSPMVTAFANHTQHFGQGMRVAPVALLDDGLLDLTFACDATRAQILAIFAQLPVGAHLGNALVRQVQVPACRLTVARRNFHQNSNHTESGTPAAAWDDSERGVINVDGEMFESAGAVYIAVVPRAIKMFAKPDSPPAPNAKQGTIVG